MTMSTKPFLKSSSFMFRTKTDFNWKKKKSTLLGILQYCGTGEKSTYNAPGKGKMEWNCW